MHIAEKYMVLIIAIRLLGKGDINRKEVQDILHFPIFKEELFYDVELYAKLIQAIMDDKALEFINNFLDNRGERTMYPDDVEANFHTLKDYCDEKHFLIHKIEEQLMYQLYCHMEGSCVYHKRKSIDYLCNHNILYCMRVFKDKGMVLNKVILNLERMTFILGKDINEMESLSFHL